MSAHWLNACAVDTVSHEISNIANIIEIVAERIVTEPESGALWAARDMLEKLSNTLEAISEDLMHAEEPKKEKKK